MIFYAVADKAIKYCDCQYSKFNYTIYLNIEITVQRNFGKINSLRIRQRCYFCWGSSVLIVTVSINCLALMEVSRRGRWIWVLSWIGSSSFSWLRAWDLSISWLKAAIEGCANYYACWSYWHSGLAVQDYRFYPWLFLMLPCCYWGVKCCEYWFLSTASTVSLTFSKASEFLTPASSCVVLPRAWWTWS